MLQRLPGGLGTESKSSVSCRSAGHVVIGTTSTMDLLQMDSANVFLLKVARVPLAEELFNSSAGQQDEEVFDLGLCLIALEHNLIESDYFFCGNSIIVQHDSADRLRMQLHFALIVI